MAVDPDFITDNTSVVRLADGGEVLVRPIVPEDKEAILDGLRRMSPESRYLRFLADLTRLSEEQLRYLTEIDYHDHFAWVARDPTDGTGIGVARYVRILDEPDVAEAAVAVVDDYQGRGIGKLLLGKLTETARSNGIRRFRGYVSAENVKLLEALERRDAEMIPEGDIIRVEMPIDERAPLLHRLFAAVAQGHLSFLYPFVRKPTDRP
jgi:GNAT superfamily N-acetyltransferase